MTKFKKIIAVSITAMIAVCCAALSVGASDDAFAISTVTTAVSSSLVPFSSANVVTVITAALTIAVPLVLTWFAFKFIYRKAKGALKGGK